MTKHEYQQKINEYQEKIEALEVEMQRNGWLSTQSEERLRQTVAAEIFEWANHPERVGINQNDTGQWYALYRSEETPFDFKIEDGEFVLIY